MDNTIDLEVEDLEEEISDEAIQAAMISVLVIGVFAIAGYYYIKHRVAASRLPTILETPVPNLIIMEGEVLK